MQDIHDPLFQDILSETFDIPVADQQGDDTTAVSNQFASVESTIDPSLLASLGSGSGYNGAYHGFEQAESALANPAWPGLELNLEGFVHRNGAWWPPIPCSHCSRLRLQCFMLQTTTHNPNPIRSCSSCVALFRDCSLAEQGKRQASYFETPEPVIGHLHGITDEELILPIGGSDPPLPPIMGGNTPSPQVGNKRSHSRSIHKTQPLRNWFAVHMDNPYPSEEEKSRLTEQSGLSRTQVTDWFTNARRRHRLSSRSSSRKVFRHGSPMPSPPLTSSMSPLERWRHSPPDQEPVSAVAIENALRETTTPHAKHHSRSSSLASSSPSRCPTSESASESCYSSGGSAFSSSSSPVPRGGGSKPLFACADCARAFKKRSDLRRHRASVHRAGDGTGWTCAVPLPAGAPLLVWRVGRGRAECVLCGREEEEGEGEGAHFRTHEFEACGRRPVEDRTFARKDHLWQHLYKFHGCRKWEGWKPDLNILLRRREEKGEEGEEGGEKKG
ncbi:hypothetical protein F4810DRAFT_703646 [Camillea tinctor]|nr:hypothetical protein F4810DRAFT_703646 [Camillea tinctor]